MGKGGAKCGGGPRGWPPSFGPSSAFSSSLRFKQAALGLRLRSEMSKCTNR